MNFKDVQFYLGDSSSAYLFVRYLDAKVDELAFLAALTLKAVNLNPSNCTIYLQKQLEESLKRYHCELKDHSGSLEMFTPEGDLPEGYL